MGRGIATLLVVAAALAPAAGLAAPPVPQQRATMLRPGETAIDAIVADAIRRRKAAGMVVGISRGGVPVSIRGYGFANLEDGTPVRPDTVFRIGSVTKQFTAACIMLLAERGQLSLEDRVVKFIPAFPRGDTVTIRQLLTHTAGVHNYTALPDFIAATAREELPTAKMVDLIARMDPVYDFAPGTKFNYSNSGYLLLGAVIERVSGQSYAAFLKANVLAPLGLSQTQVDDLAEVLPARAAGYEEAATAPTGFVNAPFISMSAASSAGAIRSTAGDLLRWHAALLGGKLLKPASLAAMLSPGLLNDGSLASGAPMTAAPAGSEPRSDYGFGLATSLHKRHRMVAHGGSINGFNAALASFPDDRVTVVVLANTGGASYALAPLIYDAALTPSGPVR